MIKRLFLLTIAFLSGSIFIIFFWLNKNLDLPIEAILFHIFLPQQEALSVCNNISHLWILLSLFATCLLLWHLFIGIRYFKWQIIFIFCFFLFDCYYIEAHFHVWDYYRNALSQTSFIRENYVSPSEKNLKFPLNKRNLIVIQVESLENTFQDKVHGGIFDQNYLPEISELAENYTSFTGMRMLPGTSWTMASVIGISMGIPFKTGALSQEHPLCQQNSRSKRKYFPNTIALNDILDLNGYTNLFLLGTDPVYAGQDDFFEQHGKTKILSLYQKDKGNAHDLDVYNYAKEVLPSVSEPFSLFIQTYDSHFDGSLNPNCSRNHSEKIFDVYRCVSKEVSDFIDYLKKQSFYNNTTIVIVGDHPNMSKNLTELIPDDYIRSPTVIFINLPFPFKGSKKRNFSTFDLFPTILSSLNVRITNNVLGLGVNLFSNEQTLIEKYGYKLISNSLKKKDDFYNMHFLMGI